MELCATSQLVQKKSATVESKQSKLGVWTEVVNSKMKSWKVSSINLFCLLKHRERTKNRSKQQLWTEWHNRRDSMIGISYFNLSQMGVLLTYILTSAVHRNIMILISNLVMNVVVDPFWCGG